MARATLGELALRVQAAVDKDEPWLADVADAMEPPQLYDNVKHMRTFRRAAMRRLAEDHAKYAHLLEAVDGG